MDLKIYSASGRLLKEVSSFYRVKTYADSCPEEVFDDGDQLPHVECGWFTYYFNRNVEPQDIRKAWNRYNNYPTSDR